MLEKAYDPKPVEGRWVKAWREKRLFRSEPAGPERRKFVVVIPPPNVTGALHLGHALNNTLQDALVRWQRLHGLEACWVPGTDHGGIATQNVMERQLKIEGLSRQGLGREGFLDRMQEWTRECKKTILSQLERLGCALDWEREAFTMDPPRARAVFEAFRLLWREGLVYRGKRMVNWCVRCGTALSDIEVEYEERKGHLWHIRYPRADGGRGLVVATTRPETMLGDTAVAVHPEDARYRPMAGKAVRLPLEDREIPVIADAGVEREFGTGAVKVTPNHDPADFEIWLRHQDEIQRLPHHTIGYDGRITSPHRAYAGLSREEARKRVVADLEAQGLLERVEDYAHAVGVCYRCLQAIEPLLSEQWFVRMGSLAEGALEALRKGAFRIYPESWAKPYGEWLSNIRDWCVSRQIWWGHRLPVWYCPECAGENLLSKRQEADGRCPSVRELLGEGTPLEAVESFGYNYALGPVDLEREGSRLPGVLIQEERPGPCPRCGKQVWLRDQDVLDTWFSSALWPMSVFGWPEKTPDLDFYYPTTVLVTGYEILYLWVARMQMMGLKFKGRVPFRDAMIHGIVRDKSGKKMSKSLGNVIDPLVMMEKYGTDALRFSLIVQAHPGRDIPFAEDSITGSRNFANKLWNSTRFVLMNLPPEPRAYSLPQLSHCCLELADRWILAEYQEALRAARGQMEAYDLAAAGDILYGFLWDRFCDWYLELSKIRLQGLEGEEKEAARAILVSILNGTLKVLHPFMPFITEELFLALKPYSGEKADFILRSAAPELDFDWSNPEARREMGTLMEVIVALRSLRAQLNVPPGLKIRALSFGGSQESLGLLQRHEGYLKTLARLSEVGRSPDGERPPHSATAVASGMSFFVPLEGLIDFTKERERLGRELAKAEAELKKLAQKVANKDFLSRAPQSEVALAQAQHQAALEKRGRLRETLMILGG